GRRRSAANPASPSTRTWGVPVPVKGPRMRPGVAPGLMRLAKEWCAMFDRMMTAMMERMSGRLSPQDKQAMMAEMMGRMFAGLSLPERISFMQSMVGACVPTITEGLDPAERVRLAEAVLGRLGEELRELAQAGKEA